MVSNKPLEHVLTKFVPLFLRQISNKATMILPCLFPSLQKVFCLVYVHDILNSRSSGIEQLQVAATSKSILSHGRFRTLDTFPWS